MIMFESEQQIQRGFLSLDVREFVLCHMCLRYQPSLEEIVSLWERHCYFLWELSPLYCQRRSYRCRLLWELSPLCCQRRFSLCKGRHCHILVRNQSLCIVTIVEQEAFALCLNIVMGLVTTFEWEALFFLWPVLGNHCKFVHECFINSDKYGISLKTWLCIVIYRFVLMQVSA